MAGLSAIASKLKNLGKKTFENIHKRSVITFLEREEIELTGVIPDDVQKGGWLVVPGPMTIEEWEAYYIEGMKKVR